MQELIQKQQQQQWLYLHNLEKAFGIPGVSAINVNEQVEMPIAGGQTTNNYSPKWKWIVMDIYRAANYSPHGHWAE